MEELSFCLFAFERMNTNRTNRKYIVQVSTLHLCINTPTRSQCLLNSLFILSNFVVAFVIVFVILSFNLIFFYGNKFILDVQKVL